MQNKRDIGNAIAVDFIAEMDDSAKDWDWATTVWLAWKAASWLQRRGRLTFGIIS